MSCLTNIAASNRMKSNRIDSTDGAAKLLECILPQPASGGHLNLKVGVIWFIERIGKLRFYLKEILIRNAAKYPDEGKF